MKKLLITTIALAMASACSLYADPENHGDGSDSSKPQGFRLFQDKLTIKPYVALSYTYDSNIDTTKHADGDNIFCVNPGVDFVWHGERWELTGGLWYRYNAYCKYDDDMDESSWGESLAYKWSNVSEEGKGWNLLLTERYRYISQSDAIGDGGRGIWRDRENIDVVGTLERRITERWHAAVMGQYNWLDYKNDTGKYAPLYGWSQYAVQGEVGFALSTYTDLLLAASYAEYTQKRGRNGLHHYSNDSSVWSVMGGIGSHGIGATVNERISYRALIGVSQLEYAGRGNTDSGWTYQLSANYRPTRNLQFTVLGNSFYQPSERELGQAIKVYSLSAGASYLVFGDHVNLTGNIAYRHEEMVYNDRQINSHRDYDEDILSIRLGASYTINRYATIFAHFLWEEDWCPDNKYYDYDRYRFTVGVRLHY